MVYNFLRAYHVKNKTNSWKFFISFSIFIGVILILIASAIKILTIPDIPKNAVEQNSLSTIEKGISKIRDIIIPEGSVSRVKQTYAKSNQIPILLERRHVAQGVYAIVKNPFGYGSTYDVNKYSLIADANKFLGISIEDPEYVPAHSHIVGAAVYAGILSIPFWLFMIFINTRIILYNYFDPFLNKFMLFLVPLSLNNMWAIFFSPFANRILLAFSVGVYIVLLPNFKKGI